MRTEMKIDSRDKDHPMGRKLMEEEDLMERTVKRGG